MGLCCQGVVTGQASVLGDKPSSSVCCCAQVVFHRPDVGHKILTSAVQRQPAASSGQDRTRPRGSGATILGKLRLRVGVGDIWIERHARAWRRGASGSPSPGWRFRPGKRSRKAAFFEQVVPVIQILGSSASPGSPFPLPSAIEVGYPGAGRGTDMGARAGGALGREGYLPTHLTHYIHTRSLQLRPTRSAEWLLTRFVFSRVGALPHKESHRRTTSFAFPFSSSSFSSFFFFFLPRFRDRGNNVDS